MSFSIFRRLSLTHRMIASFLLVTSISMVTSGFGIRALKKVVTEYEQVTEVNVRKTENLLTMRSAMEGLMSTMIQMGLSGVSVYDIQRLSGVLAKYREFYKDSEKAYLSIPFSKGEKELYEKVTEKWGALLSFVVDLLPLAQSPLAKDKIKFARIYESSEFVKARQEFFDSLKRLVSFQASDSEMWKSRARDTAGQSIFLMIVSVILGMVLSIAVGAIVASRQAGTLCEIADHLAKGADSLSISASEISQASKSFLVSMDSQVRATQETSNAVNDLKVMVSRNSQNAAASRQVVIESDNQASDGKRAIEEMLRAILEIDRNNTHLINQVQLNNNKLEEISKLIGEISGKTKVIDDIVFQTKLLSFNASVEAARAGEHGKGFSLVAEEVGNLARLSGTAAKEISAIVDDTVSKAKQIIEETHQQTEQMVGATRSNFDKIKFVAENCGGVLSGLIRKVQQVREMMDEITFASQEQSTGIQEISRAVGNLNGSMQINSSSSQKTTVAAEQLAEQAAILREAVNGLMTAVYGEKSPVHLEATNPLMSDETDLTSASLFPN